MRIRYKEDKQREYIALYLINKFIPTKELEFQWKTYDNEIYCYKTESGYVKVLNNTGFELTYNDGLGPLNHSYELVDLNYLIFKRGFCWDRDCPDYIKGSIDDIRQWHIFNSELR